MIYDTPRIGKKQSTPSSYSVSWSSFFPIFDEDMLDIYQSGTTPEESDEFEKWFGVAKHSPAPRLRALDRQSHDNTENETKRHIVAATLFWKHVSGDDPDLPAPTRESLVDARRMGLVRRFAPWDSYVMPLYDHTPSAVSRHPEVTFRLYLASDLDFLTEELASLGWEVCVMKSPSERYCPGGFWRFLPLQEEGALVTIIDTDRMNEVSHEIARTEDMARAGLGLWRVPGYYNADFQEGVRYRPILGGHFGARGGIPIRLLIEAFIWHWRRGTLPLTANIPGHGQVPLHFSKWPDYGFDELFQLIVMYPWLAPGGTLTFIPSDARSLLLPADIEYAMWANPRSEVIYF